MSQMQECLWGLKSMGLSRDTHRRAKSRFECGYNRRDEPSDLSIVHKRSQWYVLPGVHELHSKRLVFTDFARPFYLQGHMYLRVWYGEDLAGYTEGDNHGRACVDVYASFH